MLKKVYNCQEYMLNEPMLSQEKERRYLYTLGNLSQVRVNTPRGDMMIQPYDVLVRRSLMGFHLNSYNRSPLLLRLYLIESGLPSPLDQYTVGDSPFTHNLINENKSSKAYILLTHLAAKICHVYSGAVEQLEQLAQDNDKYVHFQKQKITGLLFTELLRDHENKVSKSGSQLPGARVKYANQKAQSGMIMQCAAENIQTVTLKETAAHFSYQPNYFSRLRQNLFGVTFNELRTHIRLELAKEQLRLTMKSLDEISQELGHKVVSDFYCSFKAQTGLTPREYRQESHLPNFED